MNERVRDIVQGELSRARPDIGILVAVPLKGTVDTGQHAKAPEVELPLVHQQRVVNVFLDDVGTVLFICLSNDGLDIPERFDNSDPLASVCILTWLDDPGVLGGSVLPLYYCNSVTVIALILASFIIVDNRLLPTFILIVFILIFFLF